MCTSYKFDAEVLGPVRAALDGSKRVGRFRSPHSGPKVLALRWSGLGPVWTRSAFSPELVYAVRMDNREGPRDALGALRAVQDPLSRVG